MQQSLRRIAEQNPAALQAVLQGYFARLDELEPVTRQELVELLGAGEVCLLDVRPITRHNAGHIPGSINIPDFCPLLGRKPS